MKQPFTCEQASTVVRYDPENGKFTRLRRAGQISVAGWPDYKGYLKIEVLGKRVFSHRLAWLLHYGHWPNGEIDHINGVKSDNRIANLRVCTHQQNNHNQRNRASNTSGAKNVYWHRGMGKWHVQVCLNYQMHRGGFFESLDDAVEAATALRNKLHGEFANHG